MTREEKIEAIYKEMADTDTTIGCRVQTEWFGKMCKGTILNWTNILREHWEVEENCILRNVEIIWHPVMIWDVIKRIKENREISYWEFLVKLLGQLRYAWYWKNLEASIEDQPDECIDYVYSLIQKD